MHVDVSVYSRLLRTHRRAAEVDPFVDTVELEIERLPIRTEGLAMSTPAVQESMRAGADPLFLVHAIKISPLARTGKQVIAS
jgi:hypothetical protein